MKWAGFLVTVLFLSLMSAACYKPVRYSETNESFLQQQAGRPPWHKVAVLPFSGDPAFCRANAEWLAHLIEKHKLFEIIGPALAEIELARKGVRLGESGIPIETAQEAGKILGADGVIVGSVQTSYAQRSDVFLGKKVAGVSIVDVSTGQVVATSMQSDFLTGTSTGAVAKAATEQVVNELLPALYAVAGKTWTPAPPKGPDKNREGGP